MADVQVDAIVSGSGSILQLQPLTEAASTWINEHIESEPWQWMGNRLCVEPRYMEGVVKGMQKDGLVVRAE